jgi:hypothetical protein
MSRRTNNKNMEGGALIPPQQVAVESGNQGMLKDTHIKVDNRYFAVDPNLDFEASTILCEDRVYISDQTPNPLYPISFSIQPQYNVFRSLSESRFVFTIQVIDVVGLAVAVIPKPYWAQLFINNFVCNINNVACNDQHSLTASYAGFVKILLTQGNIKTASFSSWDANTVATTININAFACDDTRTLQEGIVNIDTCNGMDWFPSYNNIVMSFVSGSIYNAIGTIPPYQSTANYFSTGLGMRNIELTYRPQDGVFLQPKLLPPGVNLNYILSTSSLGDWANGYTPENYLNLVNGTSTGLNNLNFYYNIIKAQYYERQYTPTQTALKAYQGLIMRQPLYYTCMTGNTLLYPVDSTAQSIQLTNVFSGRLPNIVVIGLLNQSPTAITYSATTGGNYQLLKTYSPNPTMMDTVIDTTTPPFASYPSPCDCINSVQLTVNGRNYPHLWDSNMQPLSNQDISQWYEQYRQCALISKLNGRCDGASNTNFDVKYKYDNPILTKAEFQSQCTFFCFNIRRSGTIMNDSGDKEIGAIDMLVNINGTNHPDAQLLVSSINTDSLMTITDGGSTCSYVL